jgi:small subunit ribosomal protein S6
MAETARYELLILSTPEITQDETKELEKQLEKSIQTASGSIISFERWGKYRLSYPVRKREYGVYFLMRFQIPKEGKLLQELKTLLTIKFETVVMRSLVSALTNDAPLEYQRPRSLEETPVATEGSFRDRRNRSYQAADGEEVLQSTDLEEDFVGAEEK